jgi:serine/threonine protein kinase
MVSARQYTKALDMWSIGCIFAEMLGNKPLFPGKNYVDQLNRILAIQGSPSEADLASIPNEKSRRYVAALPRRPKVPWTSLYPDATAEAIDLLDQLLAFNPDRRITAVEALAHPYFKEYHDPLDEVGVMGMNFEEGVKREAGIERARNMERYEENTGRGKGGRIIFVNPPHMS